jgi:hypothetical protein
MMSIRFEQHEQDPSQPDHLLEPWQGNQSLIVTWQVLANNCFFRFSKITRTPSHSSTTTLIYFFFKLKNVDDSSIFSFSIKLRKSID